MEPIEHELADRKERLKQLAIELQRLEMKRRLRPMPDWDEHDRKIINLQYQIGHARWGIKELEEIIAERRSPPPKLKKPDLTRCRELTAEEREAIATKTRTDFLKDTPHPGDVNVHVHVERFTDLKGKPQIGISVDTAPLLRRRSGPL